MKFDRRSLLGVVCAVVVPLTAGCSALRTDQGDSSTETGVSGEAGATDVFVHNLHEETVTASIRAVTIEADRTQEGTVSIDETVRLDSAGTHRVINEMRYNLDYTVSVSVEGGFTEEVDWEPTPDGGLHVMYDGSENIVFADGFNGI